MRLKSVIKYNLNEMKNGILIFYGIILIIMLLFSIMLVSVSVNDVNSSLSGMEMASAIFLFVVGLNSFKQNYLFLSTNGVTRKTQFSGFLVSSGIIAVIMAAVDTTYANILPAFVNYHSFFRQVYSGFVAASPDLFVIFSGFIWSTFLYFSMLVLGYFIRTLYYRMSKLQKIVVSIGVPALYSIILPILDFKLTNGTIGRWINEFIKTMLGLNGGNNPFAGVVSAIMGIVILACLAYLLVRRAPLKE